MSPRARVRVRLALGLASCQLFTLATLPALAAPPMETIDDSGLLAAVEPVAAAETSGTTPATLKIAACVEAIAGLAEKRSALRTDAETSANLQQIEDLRARHLARELLLSELHGHALAGSPRELVQNATMRSGLRRVAVRTLALRKVHMQTAGDTQAALARLDVEEATINGRRAVAEAELRLEHEEARRRRTTFRRIFSGARSEQDADSHVEIRVADGSDPEDESRNPRNFAHLKGYLPMPVQRRTRVTTKADPNFGGSYLAITAKAGSNVRAVAQGTVVFADELAPYGKMVVVDHGQSYFTVYGGLDDISIGDGALLTSGTVLGHVGDGVPLIFQMRAGSRTIHGLSWFVPRRKILRDMPPHP